MDETVANLEMCILDGQNAAVPITVIACSLSECHRSNKQKNQRHQIIIKIAQHDTL